jgi:hypothetical protein
MSYYNWCSSCKRCLECIWYNLESVPESKAIAETSDTFCIIRTEDETTRTYLGLNF